MSSVDLLRYVCPALELGAWCVEVLFVKVDSWLRDGGPDAFANEEARTIRDNLSEPALLA